MPPKHVYMYLYSHLAIQLTIPTLSVASTERTEASETNAMERSVSCTERGTMMYGEWRRRGGAADLPRVLWTHLGRRRNHSKIAEGDCSGASLPLEVSPASALSPSDRRHKPASSACPAVWTQCLDLESGCLVVVTSHLHSTHLLLLINLT
jgi:hypothetical protein